jgi:hypothetical protein
MDPSDIILYYELFELLDACVFTAGAYDRLWLWTGDVISSGTTSP